MEEIRVQGCVLHEVPAFKYLGTLLEGEGGVGKEVASRIQVGWCKWREMCGVLCDKRMPLRLKGKITHSIVRPAMLYGAECWAVSKKEERLLGVAEMRMLRWALGVTKFDRMENEYVREALGVNCIEQKMRESRLRWYGHVTRMEAEEVVSRVRNKRPKGRPKLTCDEMVRKDMEVCWLTTDVAFNREEWRLGIRMPP